MNIHYICMIYLQNDVFICKMKEKIKDMEILITNDDGYNTKGIKTLANIMKRFGNVTVIAPKWHQSGMGMAVSFGLKQIAYKKLPDYNGCSWAYLDATPASCVKFGLNFPFLDKKPDVVVCGINHGTNATTASCYSGTLGAAQEACINGIPAIGVSLASVDLDADFSAVEQYFPDIFKNIMSTYPKNSDGDYDDDYYNGIYYNVNFPNLPANKVKGVRVARQGRGRWIKEFTSWEPDKYKDFGITPEVLGQKSEVHLEDGEELFMMVGEYEDAPKNEADADHILNREGYIAVMPGTLDRTSYKEKERIEKLGFNVDF